MQAVTSIDDLVKLYGEPMERSLWKEIDHINDHYRQFIEKSPFLILATHGGKGVDCSPRGDPAGFVRVVNKKCLHIPDRKGNNRLDSLKNIILNGDVGIIFLVPGVGETIRVAGKGEILADENLRTSFTCQGKAPTSIISVAVDKVYYQCQKAVARSKLWDPNHFVDRKLLPTAGQMTKHFADSRKIEFDAESYDANYPEYMKKNMY